VSARVDLFPRYFGSFPWSIMVEQDALPQAKLLLESEAPLFIPFSLSLLIRLGLH